ncbi:hypothetical protein ACI2IP_13305 [Microbacterium sp. NPDC090218]
MSTAAASPKESGRREMSSSLNVALWIAAVPVALAAVRLLMFSKGDPVLLRVLFENFQILPLLTATTLLVLPWVTLTTAIVMLLNRSARRVTLRWIQRYPALIMVAFLVGYLVFVTSPFPTAFWIAGLWIVVLAVSIIGRIERPWAERTIRAINIADNDTPGAMFYSALIIPLVISILPSWSSFWLPLEEVATLKETHSAYVLGDSDGWTTLLSEDRAVLRVRSADILDRIVCDQGEAVTLQLLATEMDAPKCSN